MKVTASCKFNDHDLTDIPVLNPDGWFGKTWLLELGGCYTPLFLVVEADSLSDAIDELSDNETYRASDSRSRQDLSDYPEDDRRYDGSGQGHRPRSPDDLRGGADRPAVSGQVPRRRAAR